MHNVHSLFDIGLIHFMSYPEAVTGKGDVTTTLKKIVCDEYFKAVEVTYIEDHDELLKAKDLLKGSGMKVAYCAQPIQLREKLDLNSADETARKACVVRMLKAVDQAAELGADSFAIMSGWNPADADREAAFNRLVDSTLEICAYAAQKGQKNVALEVFDYDVDKKSLIGEAQFAKRYAEKIRESYPSFGLIVDLSHIPLLHENSDDTVQILAPFITGLHIGNCVIKDKNHGLYGDTHPRFNVEGGESGEEEVATFLCALMKNRLAGRGLTMSFEVKPYNGEDADAVVAGCKRTLDKAYDIAMRRMMSEHHKHHHPFHGGHNHD